MKSETSSTKGRKKSAGEQTAESPNAPVGECPTVDQIESRLALDDHSGALQLAEQRLQFDPDDSVAQDYVQRCEQVLTQMYLGRLGDLGQQVVVSMGGEKLQWLSIDHRAGFMVSRIQGPTTVEELLDICGMRRLDALRTLHELLQQKVISLEDPK